MITIAKTLKYAGLVLAGFLIIVGLFLVWFNIPMRGENNDAKLGVTFSHRYASDIGLNPREVYENIMDDLKVKKVRIPVYWDLVEKSEGEHDFSEIDWQLKESAKRNVEVILVVGQKVPRWPECAIPKRFDGQDEKRKKDLLEFIGIIVNRYKDNLEIKYWQVENEPFLPFGICPKFDVDLLDAEIGLVRKLDPSRQIIVTDSGELSLWVRAAQRADIFGTTMYRTIWKEGWGYFEYPIGPRFFRFKHWLNKVIAKNDRAIVIELQAEPWISGYTTKEPLEEQFKSMDAEKLKDNITFAKKVGFPEIYLWGVEWWYWLKKEKGHPELWSAAKELFQNQ